MLTFHGPWHAGKQWHIPKKAFRPGSGLTSYEKRAKERIALAAVKAKEKEMKDEKEAERQVRATNNQAGKQSHERYRHRDGDVVVRTDVY